MQFRSIYEIPIANKYIYTYIKRINVYYINKKTRKHCKRQIFQLILNVISRLIWCQAIIYLMRQPKMCQTQPKHNHIHTSAHIHHIVQAAECNQQI